MSAKLSEKIEALVRDLPEPEGARLFYERMTAGRARAARAFERDEGLLADALALAAWSPLLATTLEQNPDYLGWLARERTDPRVRTTEELAESLARFALTHSQVAPQVTLARFRRRELLRVYLHDIRHAANLVETTEELSNLADAVLRHALGLARQELENLYGTPQCTDERGRKTPASAVVVALGKLGSRELNYSSDIDILFLYSDDGETSDAGERDALTNREFFCKLAERVARIVGSPAGEGAAYRVDLRLRPHGRDGALAVSLAEALNYYRTSAHAWELQALIRSRAAAGSQALFARFTEGVRERVYRLDRTVAQALADVRLAKQKIDRFHAEDASGFNVKLGRGGIREIEFVAQALQLAHGGRDPWLLAPHTLISLGRVADRGLITERERSALSDAYGFLRTVEHRLQMEHGLQTHTVPDTAARRLTLARRMHFEPPRAREEFDAALALHTSNVSRAFRRVFGVADEERLASSAVDSRASADSIVGTNSISSIGSTAFADSEAVTETYAAAPRAALEPGERAEDAYARAAAEVFAGRLAHAGGDAVEVEEVKRVLREEAARSLNARRALALAARVAASLEKAGDASPASGVVTASGILKESGATGPGRTPPTGAAMPSGAAESSGAARLSGSVAGLSERVLREMVRMCGASELFGEMLTANPALIPSVATPAATVFARDQRALMRAAVDAERTFGGELAALRRAWTHLLVEIGARDVAGELTPPESNALQTSLAAASINVALLVARRELARRYGGLAAGPRLAALGLGRLASGGMDYGSDLDLVMVYDEDVASPIRGLTREQAYARMVELLVVALSSFTRDGHLYRVDLRLRPDGKNGPLASSSQSFVEYLRTRADVWEWLAHVKLRAVAGDLEFGRALEGRARAAVHEAAGRAGVEVLAAETRRVRERLERERGAGRGTDIKYGPGGMLDVYFAVRYLQLRDRLPDEGDDRSTRASLLRLRDAGSIGEEDFAALCEGYTLLRRLDHDLRLLAGRSTRLPAAQDHAVLRDLARSARYASAAALNADLAARMSAVRAAFNRIIAG
ncbi:MAG: [glutamine synthetase] adenylyltransferase / [glutamine synthetase]-adenylyl-L-tyrosine [Acidobacteriota bacterium]|nr:[glutamine synthetase] adenylyltransferase / [glutamine synthetase]-adenylyl-L-tyrosine [Acidobacteriota bacterium]